MSNLTRIKNNQIVNSTIIASQKIAAGTITGSLFSSNVTVPGDLLISGNLFVLGTSAYTTIASTNTYVNDPLVVLNNGFAGTNTYDEGVVFNRGSLLNQAFIWNEFNKEFRLIGTTETGTTYGNVAVSNFANLHIGNLTVDYSITHTGDFFTNGFINTTGNISAATGLFGAINSTGLINTTGNLSASQVSVATINATGFINTAGNVSAATGLFGAINSTGLINTTGNLSTAQLNAGQINTTGNVVATVFNGGAVNVSGNILASTVLAQLVTADDATFGNVNAGFVGNTGTEFTGSSINLSGNVLASSIIASYLSASTATVGNIAAVTIGNTGAIVQGLTAQFDGNVIGGLAQFAALNATPVGNATASTGAFTTLSASQNFYANASIATTTQGTGAVVVPNGGISVGGAANVAGTLTVGGATQLNNTLGVGGITTFTNSTNATAITNGAVIIQGGASVLKDLYVGGNLYAANIVGVSANVITVEDPLLFLKPSYTFPYNYDIGVYSAFTGTGLTTAGNVLQHTAIVRHQETNTWTFASNLAEPGAGHVVFDNNTVYDPIKAGNLELVNTTAATTTGTGALIVAGGAGIGGTVVAAQLNSTGNVLAQVATFNSVQVNGTVGVTGNVIGGLAQFSAINATPIGNATASTGAFTTLSASAGIWANSTTASTNTTTGALVLAGGLGLAGNIFQGGAYLDTSSSNYILAGTPTTVDAFKAATDLEIGATSGTLTINNPTVVGTQSSQDLYNITATTMNFAGAATTLVAGATSGLASIRNAVINFPNATSVVTDQTSLNLFNANVTTLNAGGAATTLTLGATTGIASIRNAVINFPNATSYLTDQTDINVLNANVLSANVLGSANSITIGSTLGFTTVRHNLEAQGLLFAENIAEATSESTGGLIAFGGAGIAGNLFVGNSAVFNNKRSTGTFQIKSSTSGNVAFFANLSGGPTTTESVIIGGGNTIVQAGVTLKISSQTTMMMPVGPTSARPSSLFGAGYDVAGMMRFNSTINNLEFYDGTQWQVTGSAFTVISDRQFSGNTAGGFGNVDGTNTVFTIQSNATTSGSIVSINGVMQFPTLAYSVSGDQLTFTEPPAPGDVIDVRILTTTTTVGALTNGNGANQFVADDDGSSIFTGPGGGSVERIFVDIGGNINVLAGSKITYDQTATQVVNTNLTLLDRFSANAYTTAKYVISMKQDTGNVQAMEALLTQSTVGTTAGTAYVTTYGIVNTGNTMGTLAANVDVSGGWVVNMWLIPNAATAISNVKVMTTYIV
jgi:hypothetical protein